MVFFITIKRKPLTRTPLKAGQARSESKRVTRELRKIAKSVQEQVTGVTKQRISKVILDSNKRVAKIATSHALTAAGVKGKKARAEIHKLMQKAEHYPGQTMETMIFANVLKKVKQNSGNPEIFTKVVGETTHKINKNFLKEENR